MSIFVCIDGIDGAGKTTQLRRLYEWFKSVGRDAELTREPGGTPAGMMIRSILMSRSSKLEPETELLLFCADRAEHQSKIRSLLDAGKDVLCDRFLPSTWAYQICGRELELGMFEKIIETTVHNYPDLTIILDVDITTALNRSLERLKREGIEVDEGRFEMENETFYRKVQKGFRQYAAEKRFGKCILMDASGSEDELFEMIRKEVAGII